MMKIQFTNPIKLSILLLTILLSSCATVSAPSERDPWESFNRSIYAFNDGIDRAVARPVAEAYQAVTPDFVETGISNFFSNLDDIIVVVNDLLQFKFKQAAQDLTRFVFNTTFGLLGFIDVASEMELPKHREDFGQTLATWGVGEGAYLVLPILGPSTVRDATGTLVDGAFLDVVLTVEDDEARWSLIALRAIDNRAGLLEATRIMEKSGIDPYVFMRDAYLQIRDNDIHDGNPPKAAIEQPTQEDLELEDELEKALESSSPSSN